MALRPLYPKIYICYTTQKTRRKENSARKKESEWKKVRSFCVLPYGNGSILVWSSFTHWTLKEHWGHNIGIIPDKSHEQMSLHHFFFFSYTYSPFQEKRTLLPVSLFLSSNLILSEFLDIYFFFCSVRKCFCCCSFICIIFFSLV